MGIAVIDFSVLEISLPTKIARPPRASMISATPFASTTTRETENVSELLTEIVVTSLWEIVVDCELPEVLHEVKTKLKNIANPKPIELR